MEIGIFRGYAWAIIRVEHLSSARRVIKKMILLLIPNKLIIILFRNYTPLCAGMYACRLVFNLEDPLLAFCFKVHPRGIIKLELRG